MMDSTDAASRGTGRSADRLLPLVYGSLRDVARRYLRRESDVVTLQPTALVHEAYLRLADAERIAWRGKTHFLAVAASEMRRILVEHARAASAKKRGGRPRRITLEDKLLPTSSRTTDLLALDEVLDSLAARSRRQARVAELRVFSGMLVREIAETLNVSERTVKGDWKMAKAWLSRELRPGGR